MMESTIHICFLDSINAVPPPNEKTQLDRKINNVTPRGGEN